MGYHPESRRSDRERGAEIVLEAASHRKQSISMIWSWDTNINTLEHGDKAGADCEAVCVQK
jgi:hypothetical protein